MGRERVTAAVLLSLMVMLAGCTTYELIPLDTGGEQLHYERGRALVTKTAGGIDVSHAVSVDESSFEHVFLIENKSGAAIFFDEDAMRFYSGNHETGRWELQEFRSAQDFYTHQERTSVLVTGLLFFTAVSGMFDDDPGVLTATEFTAPGGLSVRSEVSFLHACNRMDLLLDLAEYVDLSESSLEQLHDSLLFSSEIPDGGSHMGIVYTEAAQGPDFRIEALIEGEVYDFYFFRSDREEILDPYAEKHRDRYTLSFKRSSSQELGLSWGYHPEGTGFSLAAGFHLPELGSYGRPLMLEVTETGEVLGSGAFVQKDAAEYLKVGVDLKINRKVSSYSWLNAGIGVNYREEYRLYERYHDTGIYRDTSWLRIGESFSFSPKAGVDILYGPCCISPAAVYEDLSGWIFEIGAGLAL